MRIATFTPVSNQALKSKELPKRIKVMSFGKSTTLDEPVYVNEKTLKHFNTTQKHIGRVRVPIDFNHNTVEGSKAFDADKEPRAIAGYGTPRVGLEGLWLEDIQWTPSGEKAARDYEDLSPAPILDEDGVVVGLHSVALTPAGAIEDLHFYSADSIFTGKPMKMKLSTDEQEKEKAVKLQKHLKDDIEEGKEGVVEDEDALKDAKESEEHEEEEVKTENAEDVEDIDHKGEEHEEGCTCPACAQKKTISTHAAYCLGADEKKVGERKMKTMSAVFTPKAYETEPHEVKTFKTYMHEEIKQMAADLNLPNEAELEKRLRALLAKWLGADGEEVPEGPITNKANSTPAQFSAEVKNLTDRLAVLENDRKEAIARYEAQEKQSIVSEATRNGKVVPFSAEELKEISPKILKSVVDKLPKEVPTKLTTKVLNADGKSTKPTMSDAASAWQDAVNSAMARA